MFLKDIPAAFHLNRAMKVSGLLRETAAQIRDGMIHGSVSHWIEERSYRGSDLLCLIYQGDLHAYSNETWVAGIEILQDGRAACSNAMDVEVTESRESYGVEVKYNSRLYDKRTVEAFAERLCGLCAKLVQEGASDLTLEEILG